MTKRGQLRGGTIKPPENIKQFGNLQTGYPDEISSLKGATQKSKTVKRRRSNKQDGARKQKQDSSAPQVARDPEPEKNECAKKMPEGCVAHAEKKTPVLSCVIKLYKLVYFVAEIFLVTPEEDVKHTAMLNVETKSAANCWFKLQGHSGIAETACQSDLGRHRQVC